MARFRSARALAGISREDFATVAGLPIRPCVEGSDTTDHSEQNFDAVNRAPEHFVVIVVGGLDGMGAGANASVGIILGATVYTTGTAAQTTQSATPAVALGPGRSYINRLRNGVVAAFAAIERAAQLWRDKWRRIRALPRAT